MLDWLSAVIHVAGRLPVPIGACEFSSYFDSMLQRLIPPRQALMKALKRGSLNQPESTFQTIW
jgi:hypothetical protein